MLARPLRLRHAITLGLAFAVAVPVTAWATHDFADVPTTSPYHDDVSWLRDNGITAGCRTAEGETFFCPGDDVTREQLAAMLHRLATSDAVVGEPGPAGPTGATGPQGPSGGSGAAGPRGPSNAYASSSGGGWVGTTDTTLWSGTVPAGDYVFDASLYYFNNSSRTTVLCTYYVDGTSTGRTTSLPAAGSDFESGSWTETITAGSQVDLRCRASDHNLVEVREMRVTAIAVASAQPFPTASPVPG